MASIIYLSISGERQGTISSGCGTEKSIGNKWQKGHENEIFVYEASNIVTSEDNLSLHPFTIRKPIDKATPLLLQALNDKESLKCYFNFFRVSPTGGNENYFKVMLEKARVVEINYLYPSSLTHNDLQPQESISFKFATMTFEHITANTSAWVSWQGEY